MTMRHFLRTAGLLAVLFLAAGASSGGGAAEEAQPRRFLLVFETSTTLKKYLPAVHRTLDRLCASNLQNQLQSDDDVAVWTVDDKLHPGAIPLASWVPEEAVEYAGKLNDFLEHQKYSSHATLSAIQPLLNRLVKSSDALTVLIFCDSLSRLSGTPYDEGVNSIITNSAAKNNGVPSAFILVLRSYHGQYLGCSVNRSSTLEFPPFPTPVKPAPATNTPPAAVAVAPVAPAMPPVTGPVVTPVPALIIVGTQVGTNPADLPQLTAAAAAAAATATNPAPVPPAAPLPLPTVPLKIPATVAPVPAPAPVPPAATPTPLPPAATAPLPAPMPLPAATNSVVQTTATPTPPPPAPAATGFPWGLTAAMVGLVMAGMILGMVLRSRRPRSSLITSSMQNDPRRPK